MDFLRCPRFESIYSTFCRRRDRPSFDTPGLRYTDTNRRSGKSHAAFGLRHVDISLRTIFLPSDFLHHPIDIGFETRGAVSMDPSCHCSCRGGVTVSVHFPGFVVELEYSFLKLSRIQRCRWSDRVGVIHETVSVIDLVISEATLNEHVVSTLV